MPAPPDDAVDRERHQRHHHNVVGVVEERTELLPVAAQLDADVAEEGHPRHAAEHRVQSELPEAHLAETGGQRDERAHDRDDAAEEHDGRPVVVEPVLRRVEVMRAQQHVLAPAVDKRPPAEVAHGVGDPRADEVARHPGHDDADEGQRALAHGEAGEGHDGLAGHGDAGALEEHQEEHGRQAPGADEVRRPLDDVVDDGLHAA